MIDKPARVQTDGEKAGVDIPNVNSRFAKTEDAMEGNISFMERGKANFKGKYMNTDSVKALYTDRVNIYHFLFYTLLRYHKSFEAFFRAYDPLQPGDRVLEAGCGTGLITKLLVAQNEDQQIQDVHFDAFDLTPAMLKGLVEWVEEKGVSSVQTRQADVLDPKGLPDYWTNYDRVVTAAMLEYIDPPELSTALALLRGRMKPGAPILIFMTKKNMLMKWVVGNPWQANMYRQDEFCDHIQKAGFTEITFKRFPFPYNYMNLWAHIVEAKA